MPSFRVDFNFSSVNDLYIFVVYIVDILTVLQTCFVAGPSIATVLPS